MYDLNEGIGDPFWVTERLAHISDNELSEDEIHIKYPLLVFEDGRDYYTKNIINESSLEMRVYNDDGKTPRLHIINTSNDFHSIIDLLTGRYASDTKNKLSISEIDNLIQTLSMEIDNSQLQIPNSNIWVHMVQAWDSLGNTQLYLPNGYGDYNKFMPNFNLLKGE